MPACEYCEESFEGEGAYLDHLGAAHYDELGRIDRRRVDARQGDPSSSVTGPRVLLGVVSVVVVGFILWLSFGLPGGGGGAAPTPTGLGQVHEHGTMTVVIQGERIDFSQSQYQVRADPFHFEGGNGRIWHKHARDVTLQWGMDTLGIHVTGDSVKFGGATFTDGEGYRVSVTVNGQAIDPATYVLQGVPPGQPAEQGDSVRIVVEQTS